MNAKKVYLIGAGPGDPGLITVRGLEILRQADCVIYDYLVDKRILEEAKPGAELVSCDTLGKKRYSDGFIRHNEKVDALIVKKALEGKKVVRLKNGDPSVFSRLSQELEALVRNRIPFEVVPGVTAASGAACSAGIPLTDRKFASSCVFVTGHEDPAKKNSAIDWRVVANSGTAVFYMAMDNLAGIVRKLVKAGKPEDTPAAVIQDATGLNQKTVTGALKDIVKKARAEKLRPPAIVIVGKVVGLGDRFNRMNRTKKVLFTGLSKERFFEKQTYTHLPLIRITPLDDYSELDVHLADIERFDWIVFSSRYGVEYFFKRLAAIDKDSRALSGVKIAAIGNSTKAILEGKGIRADLVPAEESSRGLLKEFAGLGIKGKRIFLPRSDVSDKNLNRGFEALGAKVTASFAYRNVAPAELPDLELGRFDEVMLTSPSVARNFAKRYRKVPGSVRVSCIGDVTHREAAKWDLLG